MGAGIGVLQGALMTLLFGDGKTFEKSCLSILDYDSKDTRYTIKENFIEYVRMRYPEKAEMLEKLIETFPLPEGQEPTKTSNWDHEGFFNLLRNEIAGRGSNDNCEEFWGYYIFGGKQKEDNAVVGELPEPVLIIPPSNRPEPPIRINTPPQQELSCLVDIQGTIPYNRHKGDTWEGIIEAFYPSWKDCFDIINDGLGRKGKGAVQVLKREMARDPETGEINEEIYNHLLNDKDLPDVMYLPAAIGDCLRLDKATVKPRDIKPGGGGVSLTQAGYRIYIASDGCDETSATGDTPEEAIQNLSAMTKRQYPNADEVIQQFEQAE